MIGYIRSKDTDALGWMKRTGAKTVKSRNDSKGYERGAKGIDGKEGQNYTDEGRSTKAEKAMYGQCWWGEDGTKDISDN